MDNVRTVVFAPHDDGSGGFGVLSRLARALLRVADDRNYELHLYFLNSSVAVDGQDRLSSLLLRLEHKHKAIFVPTDNLIFLPKDKETLAVVGSRIPDVLRKWVRPLWHFWPCEANWIRTNLPIMDRDAWSNPDVCKEIDFSKEKWKDKALTGCGTLRNLTTQWWQDVALGISMGVPQLHRLARRECFPSVEVGDWFFSVGLRGCMQESFVPPEIISSAEPDLRMIEEDELKAREVWLTLYQAPHEAYKAHVANSSVKFREMTGLLWTGDPPPEDMAEWSLANKLRKAIDIDISQIRDTQAKRVGYIVPGSTPVWRDIVDKLRKRQVIDTTNVAILDLNRGNGTITLLENDGKKLGRASQLLEDKNIPSEEKHLATCRACDFGITRTAGGVLGFVETQRPSVLVDEPGHWLGRIQREQCQQAGLCVVIPISEFLTDPAGAIQKQADKIDTNSNLDQIVEVAKKLKVGAEQDLAEYLFTTYIK